MNYQSIHWTSVSFALLLVVSALLQFNDPDPVRWVLFYLSGAAVLAISAGQIGGTLRKVTVWAGILVACAGVSWGLWILGSNWALLSGADISRIGESMSSERPENELLKEIGGLVLSSAMMVWNFFRHRQ